MLIKFILFLALIFLGMGLVSYVNDDILISGYGFVFEIKSVSLLLLFVILNLLIYVLFKGIAYIAKIPTLLFKPKNVMKDIEKVLCAINKYDFKSASKYLKNIKHANENIYNILDLYSILLLKDREKVKNRLCSMIHNDFTKVPALEALIDLAEEDQNYEKAAFFMEELYKIQPTKDNTIGLIVIYIQLEKWEKLNEVVDSLELERTEKRVVATIARHKIALNYFKLQMYKEAKEFALSSYAIDKDFSPNLLLLAQLNIDVEKNLKKSWAIEPSLESSDMILTYFSKLSSNKKFDAIYKIASFDRYEDHLLKARVALDVGNFDAALTEIQMTLSSENSKFRACLIMAEYCQKSHGDISETIYWLKKAAHSEIDTSSIPLYLNLKTMSITHIESEHCIKI